MQPGNNRGRIQKELSEFSKNVTRSSLLSSEPLELLETASVLYVLI